MEILTPNEAKNNPKQKQQTTVYIQLSKTFIMKQYN